MNKYVVNFFVWVALFLTTAQVRADMVFDSGGFEAYTLGTLVGQSGGNGIVPWTDLAPPGGNRFMVQNTLTNGGSRAVSVSSTDAGDAFVAPLFNLTVPAGELLVVEVDVARTAVVNGSPAFFVDIYDTTARRVAAFGLASPAAQNVSIVPFVTRFNGTVDGADVFVGTPVQQSEYVRFRAELNYQTQMFELKLNGTSAGTFQFVNQATVFGDADLAHLSVAGATDVGYFDNYRISTVAVPEPNAAALVSLIALGIGARRSRRSACRLS